jgi:hypothetical protein
LSATSRFLTELISRVQLAAASGLTFAGARDLYKVLGYKPALTPRDYRERYERHSVAARVVDSYPKSTWRGFVELIEDEDPQVLTPFEEAWVELATRLKVNAVFKRADILAGLGEYAVIVIGAPGPTLETPLPDTLAPEDIVYLQPYSQADAPIFSYISDDQDPRYGLPEFYTIKRVADGPLLAGNSRPSMKDVRCHWTRVIHLSDGLLDDNVLGIPRLKRVWNDLDNLDKVVGGGSEAFWMKANGGVLFDVDPTKVKFDKQSKEELQTELDEHQHGQRRFLRTRGVTPHNLGSEAVDFSSQVASCISLISAGSEIPQRLLLGSERGELASTQDRENWKERVQDRRDEYAGPSVLHVFVDRMIEHGALPEPAAYEVRWPEVHDESKTEQAALAETWAGLNSKAGETVVTGDEIRDRILGLPPLEEVLDPEELALREQRDLEVETVTAEEDDEEEAQPRAAKQLKSTLLLFIARQTPTSDGSGKRSWARPAVLAARSASERSSRRSEAETEMLSSKRSTRQAS